MTRKARYLALVCIAAALGAGGAWVYAERAAPPAVAVARTIHGRSVVVDERGHGPDIVILSRRNDASVLAAALARRHRVIVAPPAVARVPPSQSRNSWLDELELTASVTLVVDVSAAGAILDALAGLTGRDIRLAALDLGRSSLDLSVVDRLLDAAPHVWVLSNRRGVVWERFRTIERSGNVHVSLLDACEQGHTPECSAELAGFVEALDDARPLTPTAAIVQDAMRSGGAGPATVVVPNGQFRPGSTDGASDWRRPAPSVRLRHRLAVARTETTVADFRRFVSATGYRTQNGCWSHTLQQEWLFDDTATWSRPVFPQTDDHPVTCVTYEDAQAYIGWIRAETGRPYRLPGDAEFEFFNRSGHRGLYGFDVTEEAPLCAWANGADRTSRLPYANPCTDGFAETSPVGAFGRNDFGLSDTTGNVWELTAECWRNGYLRIGLAFLGWGPRAIPGARASCPSRHIVRGGSFISSPRNLRADYRDIEGYRSSRVGFRLVRDLR
jgi:formylglycine-generating enzyme required for sulfatase activity